MTVAFDVAQAQSLREMLIDLTKNHKRVLAAAASVEGAKEGIEVARGDWYPNVGVTANYGKEQQNKPSGSDDTNMVPRNLETTITQKLWDFGSTNSSIRRATLVYRQADAQLDSAVQGIILEGVSTHLNVMRFQKLLNFAKGSAENIKRQAELEDAKVQRGSGFTTDVLQAKSQLAGALGNIIRSERALLESLNAYQAVFGKAPNDVDKMREPRLPLELLPKSLDELLSLVRQDSPTLLVDRLTASIAREDVSKTRADEFMPTFDVIGEHKIKEESGGTAGSQQEWKIKLEAGYDFNLGFTAVNSLRASRQAHIASVNQFGDRRDVVELQARNAWHKLETAKREAEHRHNQVDIASEFLDLARRERQLGNRSLIDVLGGETNLINAASDAASADADVAITVFEVLAAMGHLDATIID